MDFQKFKKMVAAAEQGGKTEGNWAQFEPIVLKDLQKNKGQFKDVSFDQVMKDPKLYDQVAEAYAVRMNDFGVPDDELSKALWWLMPGRYNSTGGNIANLKNPDFRNIMSNRVKNISTYLQGVNLGG
jgi:hypothetical protein